MLPTKAGSIINELPSKTNVILLLGPELDMLLTEYIKKLRKSKAVINSLIVSASNGIVKNKDSNLLHCNGIHIEFSRAWAKHFLDRISYFRY